MDRGAWQATVHGSQRVRHDWAINFHFLFLSNVNINRSCMCKPSQLFSKRMVIPVIYWCVTRFPKISGVKPQCFRDALILCSGIWMRHSMNTLSFLTVSGTSTGNSQWLRTCRVAEIRSLEPEDYFKIPPISPAWFCGWAWQRVGMAGDGPHWDCQPSAYMSCSSWAASGQSHFLPGGGCPRNRVGICCMAFYTLVLGDKWWHVHCILLVKATVSLPRREKI